MALKEELIDEIKTIYKDQWTIRDGNVVPADSSVKLLNDAVKINGAVLYADIADSTRMVAGRTAVAAAEIYKAFLRCAARIILAEGGTVTAYDGDRVMAVFVGDGKETTAVRVALKINWAVRNIVVAERNAFYKTSAPLALNHVVGIDTSELFVARTGVRGSNDLVWVGRAANYAAKLSALAHNYSTYITNDVWLAMDLTVTNSNGVYMWNPLIWTEFDNSKIHGSTYWWRL